MMSDITLLQMPAFKKTYKKLHKQTKKEVDNAIRVIVKDPKIGTEKKGDLSGVFVYKFKIHQQEFLLAYEWDPKTRILHALGVHENFYRDLKKTRS
jgi:mRNA-degrading endonuclease RelE of RelBE toxin-antitoxin system